MKEGSLVAGLEAGGTKCICILARSPDDIVEQVRIDTRDPASTLSEVDAIFDRWHAEHAFDAIGISSFGPLDIDRTSPDYGSIVSTPIFATPEPSTKVPVLGITGLPVYPGACLM